MGNIERRFEQKRTFCHLLVLDRNIFGENILFVQSIVQCFLKGKQLENEPFYAKNSKMAGEGKLYDFILLNRGYFNDN